ncbi:hypothetical protein K5D34_01400 [Pseudomonas cichorii]|nr:hypothetical protein [Pseudomonas cichorii]MBX8508347.1 hypothetical protein [Pseudomonas cichorii]MBX8523314.1 hypothetical protein [Pseudomonas cichorii]MBX8543773.1 hypothetical protein [Pseudomonas cichorii]MBX8589867.1 hypothetical protein [Pseudomonas cichorii]MBX8604254.1 hypothetical protein [Pseudomonas cichorii]
MFKKTCLTLFATAVFATSNAYALCLNISVNRSGTDFAPNTDIVVYGPYNSSCSGTQSFIFKDLSSRSPVLQHILEKQNGSTWTVVGSSITYGNGSPSFYAPTPGTYRYRIENIGTSVVGTWTVTGKTTL